MKSKSYAGGFDQSGIVPFRIKNRKLQYMMITSRNRGKWIFPKGIIEHDMTAEASAIKEAYEEAGISGAVYTEINAIDTYEKWDGEYRVRYFPMKVSNVSKEWPESDFRKRRWVSPEKADELIQSKSLRRLMKTLYVALSEFESF